MKRKRQGAGRKERDELRNVGRRKGHKALVKGRLGVEV